MSFMTYIFIKIMILKESFMLIFFLNRIVDYHIVQLPSNHIPKGLVSLERLFD
jgi:hypothetical protein